MKIKELQLRQIIRESIRENLLLERDSRLKAVDRIIDSEFSGLLNPDGVVRSDEYYVNGNPQTTWRQYLLYSLRHTFGLMNNNDVPYLPLVAKLAFGNEVQFEKTNDNGRQIALLQKIVLLLKKQPELFQELNEQIATLTFSKAYNLLKNQIDAIEQADSESANQVQQRDDYDILEVPDFKTANYYGNYSCSQSKLCYTQSENTWDSYKGGLGENRVYVCLKKGWQDIPEQPGEGNPYDDYGTSMIFVFIDPEGNIATSNCRWNHHVTGKYIGDTDHAFTKTSLAETVGRNFSETFKPYSKEVLDKKGYVSLRDIPELLEKGVDLTGVLFLDTYTDHGTGHRKVYSNKKYNWLTSDKKILSPDLWFDTVYDFYKVLGHYIGMVRIGEYYNWIKADGTLLWDKPIDEWFQNIPYFTENFAKIEVRGKSNFIDINGNLVSPNRWFSEVKNFNEGHAVVMEPGGHNNKFNYIDEHGNLLLNKPIEKWFDDAENFYNGYAQVEINYKYNLIDENCNFVSNDWYDECSNFIYCNNECARVVKFAKGNGYLYNLMDKNGEIVFPDMWFEHFTQTFKKLITIVLNKKYNFINQNKELVFKDYWLDNINPCVSDVYCIVYVNGKVNFIDYKGDLVWNKPPQMWFDSYDIPKFMNYIKVFVNNKQYILNKDNGKLYGIKPENNKLYVLNDKDLAEIFGTNTVTLNEKELLGIIKEQVIKHLNKKGLR